MNLSLYLLLAPSTDAEQAYEIEQQTVLQAKQGFVPIYDPLGNGKAGNRRLVQASRKRILTPASRGTAVQTIGFGISVVSNALGFLAMTGGVLLLLRVAEISLI